MEDERCGRKSKGAAALDVIIVLPTGVSDGNDLLFNEQGAVASSDFFVQFPDRTGSSSFFRDLQFHTASVCTVDVNFGKEEAQAVKEDHKLTQDDSSLASNHISVFINNQCIPELSMERKSGGNCTFAKGSLRPQPNILKSLVKKRILTPGEHVLRYVSNGTNSVKYVDARLFVWYSTDKLIVSDIDGTVTKSDISGVLDTVIRESYSHVHRGICKFFSDLVNVSTAREQSGESKASNVRIFYLTSRPLSLLHSTRKFLDSLEQDSYKLPAGPIFCHLGSLSEVLVTELWRRNTHEFKSDVITKQVLNPFQEAGRNPSLKLFIAAFGNKDLDAAAYEMAGIELQDIYIINKESEIVCAGKSSSTSWRSFLDKYSPQDLSQHEVSILDASNDLTRSGRFLNSSQRSLSPTDSKVSASIKQFPREIINKSRESYQKLKNKVRGHTFVDDPDEKLEQQPLDSSSLQLMLTNEQRPESPLVPPRYPIIRVISETFSRSISDSSSTSLTERGLRQTIVSSKRSIVKKQMESFSSYDDPSLGDSLREKILDSCSST